MPSKTFSAAIRRWMKDDIEDSTINALVFRLDEFAVGGVTPSSLDNLVGDKPMKEAIGSFEDQGECK